MAKKKRVVRKVKRSSSSKASASISKRMKLAWRNLLLFLVLFLASYVLYSFSETNLFLTFFGILAMIFGFVSLAFFIAFVVLLISRNKK